MVSWKKIGGGVVDVVVVVGVVVLVLVATVVGVAVVEVPFPVTFAAVVDSVDVACVLVGLVVDVTVVVLATVVVGPGATPTTQVPMALQPLVAAGSVALT
jgi:hypothetical protein